jgi:hypothetical protein
MSASRSDTGHYYRRDGSPCYEVANKTGGMRAINLAWDKTLNLVPSVTTVLSVTPKPQLEIWKQNQMMLAALTVTRKPNESDDEFCNRIRQDAFQQVTDAADVGTLVHDAIEQFYRGRDVPAEYWPHVAAISKEVLRLFPAVNDWVPERYFAHPLGFGGKVDLHSPSTGHVVDFKGKDGDFADKKRLAYDQHYQLAPYQQGLKLPQAECANIFFSRTHPGKVASFVWTKEQIAEGWEFFQASLVLWKLWKKYDPSFANPHALQEAHTRQLTAIDRLPMA